MELCYYMLTVARILYAQRQKDKLIPKMEEWMGKMMELTEMAKLTALIKELIQLETASGLYP